MPSSRTVVIGLAAAVFVVSSVLPLLFMLASSLFADSPSPIPQRAWLLEPRQRTLLSNTTVLGLSTAVLATLIGAPLGLALARIDLPWKRTLRVLLAAPMLLPPYIAGLAWVSLGGSVGLASQWVGRDVLSTWTYSLPGAVLVLALVFYPVSMLATEAAVRRIEPHLEEAALIVAGPRLVLWHITLRLAAPSITGAALLIFVFAISEFGVPGLLRVRVFTTEVFTAFAALYDFGRATMVALPLLFLSTIVAAVAVAVAGQRHVTTSRGMTSGRQMLDGTWTHAGASVAAVVVVATALVLPLALLWSEARDVRSWAEALAGSGAAIRYSLVFAAIGATLTTTVGFVLGYACARSSRRAQFVADLGFVVLFAVPSTIVGVGLIALWNRSGPLGAFYGTDVMLLLGYLARFLPLAALGMAAAVRQVPVSHEEAAAAAGAGWTRTMLQIVVPQVGAASMAVWVVVFVLAFGELGVSILIAPPGETTLPIRIYTLIANAPPSTTAALAVLQVAVILSPLLLLARGVAARNEQ